MEDLGLAGCPIFGEAEAGDPVCCPSPGQPASSRAMGCCWEKDAEPLGACLCLHVLLLGTQIPAPSSGTFSLSISMTTLSAATSPPPFQIRSAMPWLLLALSPLNPFPQSRPPPWSFGGPQTSWGVHGQRVVAPRGPRRDAMSPCPQPPRLTWGHLGGGP